MNPRVKHPELGKKPQGSNSHHLVKSLSIYSRIVDCYMNIIDSCEESRQGNHTGVTRGMSARPPPPPGMLIMAGGGGGDNSTIYRGVHNVGGS